MQAGTVFGQEQIQPAEAIDPIRHFVSPRIGLIENSSVEFRPAFGTHFRLDLSILAALEFDVKLPAVLNHLRRIFFNWSHRIIGGNPAVLRIYPLR